MLCSYEISSKIPVFSTWWKRREVRKGYEHVKHVPHTRHYWAQTLLLRVATKRRAVALKREGVIVLQVLCHIYFVIGCDNEAVPLYAASVRPNMALILWLCTHNIRSELVVFSHT